MKIAVTPWFASQAWTAKSLSLQAVQAEKLGFSGFWIPENHFGDDKSIPSPLTLLAAVASNTSTISLGTTSYLITIRHPLQAAEEIAVLDQLCEGRLILGLGRGMMAGMFDAFGLPIKEKRKQFKTNLDIIISSLKGMPISLKHQHEKLLLAPPVYQKPHPPIWLAAFGRLALKQAGELGFPYLASPLECLQVLESNYSAHQNHCLNAGHAVPLTIPLMRSVFVSQNRHSISAMKTSLTKTRQIRQQQTKSIHAGAVNDGIADNIDDWAIVGDPAYVKDKLAEYQSRLGMNYMIASGRLPKLSTEEQISSHKLLMSIAN